MHTCVNQPSSSHQRHTPTPTHHSNRLGVFTGWEDAPLANEGRVEARKAGRLLKRHGIELDVVYTSWLSRAIETAWLLLDELDCLWLPIIKSWRLNERMYGALTGLSKKMIAQRHGEAKFRQWRRSYATRPPEVSSFSAHYPGNDDRYVKYVSDLRVSVRETLIRSLSDRRFKLHRNYPKTESLKDCMSRTIPFFTDTIVPQSIAKGKTVLVASSENAIRGLLMHLCDIPSDRIAEVEIPTGLPLVYNINKRCIQLLETGEEDPADPIGHLGACVLAYFGGGGGGVVASAVGGCAVGWAVVCGSQANDAHPKTTRKSTRTDRLRHLPGAAVPALRRERRPVLHRRGGAHLQVRPLDPPARRCAQGWRRARGDGRPQRAAAAGVVHGGVAVIVMWCVVLCFCVLDVCGARARACV